MENKKSFILTNEEIEQMKEEMKNTLREMAQTPNETYIGKCTLISYDEEENEEPKKYKEQYLLLNNKDSNGEEGTDIILENSFFGNLWYNCDFGVEDLEIVKKVSTLNELIDYMKSVGIDLSNMRTEKGIMVGCNDMINDNLYTYIIGDKESDVEFLFNEKEIV